METSERFASDNIIEIIDKYKDKLSAGDYSQLLELIRQTGDYQTELLSELETARKEYGEVMKLMAELGFIIDKAKEQK